MLHHTIRLWNPASGVCEATLESDMVSATALTVLADGQLALGTWDHTTRLWNPTSGACEATLEAHTVQVCALAVLADGRLASGSLDSTIRAWQDGNGRWAGAVRFVADAGISALAFAARNGGVRGGRQERTRPLPGK